ncbi:MAG: HD-GYP domain-containing protein [Nitrospirota bacterium]
MMDISDTIYSLARAIKGYALYPRGHPVRTRVLERLYMTINDALKSKQEMIFGVLDGEIVFEGRPFFTELSEYLRSLGIEKITFLRDLKKKELNYFIDILSTSEGLSGRREVLGRKIEELGISNIKLGDIKVDEVKERIIDFRWAKEAYKKGIEIMKVSIPEVSQGDISSIRTVREFVDFLVDGVRRDMTPFLALSALKTHDEYTFTHSMNVCILTMIQAKLLKLDSRLLHDIGIAGLFHDIGKEVIPVEIITKPDKLTEDEFRMMQRHPIEGAKILEKIPGINPLCQIVAFEHHMKYDFSGYPKTHRKRELNLCSLLCTIADVYDALRSIRAYRRETPPDVAATIMEGGAGKDFDPFLLNHFIKMLGVYPVGTVVRLDTGEIGIVYRLNPDAPLRPQIRLLFDEKGVKIEEVRLANLSDKDSSSGRYIRSIISTIEPAVVGIEPAEYL